MLTFTKRRMESNFIEFYLDKDKTVRVCVRLNNILYILSRTADKTRLYLIDGTPLDIYERYENVCFRLMMGFDAENENLV